MMIHRRMILSGGFAFLFLLVSVSIPSRAENSMDEDIREVMAIRHIPGVSACVVKNGRIVWTGSYGQANIEAERQVTDSTLFMLASISKTVTMTALMQLWENEAFELDDNLADYLPFDLHIPNYPVSPITFRQLLSHTSSLKDNWSVGWATYVEGDTPWALADFAYAYFDPAGSYYNQYQNFSNRAPGTNYDYCNHGYMLAGYLVETISGMPFADYCREFIFTPLGMEETSWFIADLDETHVAMPYRYSGGAFRPEGHFGYADYPAGTLRTSASQLARFLIAFGNHGMYEGTRLLNSATVDTITTIHFPHLQGNQGLAWYNRMLTNELVWQHEGGDLGVSTMACYSFAPGLGVIVLTNGESSAGTKNIRNLLFNEFLTTTSVTLREHRASWAGNHVEVAWRLDPADDQLSFLVSRSGSSDDTCVPLPGAVVICRGNEFLFEDHDTIPESTHRYRITVLADGMEVLTFDAAVTTPAWQLALPGNYPNPFNPVTTIGFVLDRPGRVNLAIYDLAGRLVKTLVNESRESGRYTVRWNGLDARENAVASGTYFIRLRAGDRILSRQSTLLR